MTLRLPFLQLLAGLSPLAKNTASDLERGYSAFLMGAKDFTRPEGLGIVSSRNCYIGIQREGTQPNIASDFSLAKYDSIEGIRAWTWSMAPYEGYPRPTEFYAAQVAGYFVMTNNRQDFREIAGKLAAAKSSAASPATAPGWDTFGARRYWAYRLIRRSGVADPDATGLKNLNEAATALNFSVDIRRKEGYLQVHSSDKTMDVTPKGLPAPDLIRYKPAGAGIWQATIPCPGTKIQILHYFNCSITLDSA